jgi:glycerol-1-phosphate dehydrogenase [NAD(P)+]
VLSGFGMTICGGSFPASQGEHLISHTVEMMAPADWPESFHGEQIGVATLTMARLQERLLAGGPPRLDPSTVTETAVKAHFGTELGSACWREFAGKRLDETGAAALNARLEDGWESIRTRLAGVTRTSSTLAAVLDQAGAPTTPEALGWPPAFYRDAVRHAREIRDRYTFLDLAADSGLFEQGDVL